MRFGRSSTRSEGKTYPADRGSKASKFSLVGSDGAGANTTSEEIARSLGSVWQRFSGKRPKSTTVEVDNDVVRCVIEEKAPEAWGDEDGGSPAGAHLARARGSRRFDYNATAAVARVKGRRVIAFIPKRDKRTHTSTQTFILDQPQARF
jgi:hypothetical protein